MTSVTQGPVVQKADNVIHRINLYQVDNSILLLSLRLICWIVLYLVDGAIHDRLALVVQKMDNVINWINL